MKKYITLAIMLTLLDGKVHKAKQLSEKFEASLKTIYRSIDTLLEAGMPLSVTLGRNGGFSLIDTSKIDSGFFTNNELCSFLSYIGANPGKFDGITNTSLFERIKNSCNKNSASIIEKSQQVVIDTDVWGSAGNFTTNQELISEAIENMFKLKIEYAEKENSTRTIHPYALVFKTGSWYVYSFCELKNSFRLFKLSRIKKIEVLPDKFERQNINCLNKPWNTSFQKNLEKITITLEVKNSFIPELYDWLGGDFTFINKGESTSTISAVVFNSYGLIHRIMQYGNNITVLSPTSLISDIKNECESIYKKYQTYANYNNAVL